MANLELHSRSFSGPMHSFRAAFDNGGYRSPHGRPQLVDIPGCCQSEWYISTAVLGPHDLFQGAGTQALAADACQESGNGVLYL